MFAASCSAIAAWPRRHDAAGGAWWRLPRRALDVGANSLCSSAPRSNCHQQFSYKFSPISCIGTLVFTISACAEPAAASSA